MYTRETAVGTVGGETVGWEHRVCICTRSGLKYMYIIFAQNSHQQKREGMKIVNAFRRSATNWIAIYPGIVETLVCINYLITKTASLDSLHASLKTDLRFARPKIRGSTERAKRRSDENVVKIAFRPLYINNDWHITCNTMIGRKCLNFPWQHSHFRLTTFEFALGNLCVSTIELRGKTSCL
jgi:hypothetical protein